MKMQEYIEETRSLVPQLKTRVRRALDEFRAVRQLCDDYRRCETVEGRETLARAIAGAVDGGFAVEFDRASEVAMRLVGLNESYRARLGPRKPKPEDARQMKLEGLG